MRNHSRPTPPKQRLSACQRPGVADIRSRHCGHWHRQLHRTRRPQRSKRTPDLRRVRRPGALPIPSGSPQGSGRPPPTPPATKAPLALGAMLNRVAGLQVDIAAVDADLGPEFRDATRRTVVLVRLLEAQLAQVAGLEQRLGRVIGTVEESTGRRCDDGVHACLAGQLGLLRVRSALERLALPQSAATTQGANRTITRLPSRP